MLVLEPATSHSASGVMIYHTASFFCNIATAEIPLAVVLFSAQWDGRLLLVEDRPYLRRNNTQYRRCIVLYGEQVPDLAAILYEFCPSSVLGINSCCSRTLQLLNAPFERKMCEKFHKRWGFGITDFQAPQKVWMGSFWRSQVHFMVKPRWTNVLFTLKYSNVCLTYRALLRLCSKQGWTVISRYLVSSQVDCRPGLDVYSKHESGCFE